MATTIEEVEQDSSESKDCLNLMSTLFPAGRIPQVTHHLRTIKWYLEVYSF